MLIALDARAAGVFAAQGLRWPGLWILSGWRSAQLQAYVNPLEPASRHRPCPSLAADLRVGDFPASTTTDYWRVLGTLWKAMGGRWGGDFPTPDLNHFELLSVRGGAVAAAPTFSRLASREEVTPIPRAAPTKRQLRDLAPGPIMIAPRAISRRPSLRP